MKRDAHPYPISGAALGLIATGRWELVELADGAAAQALAPGIPAAASTRLESPEIGPADDVAADTDTPDLFGGP